MQFRADAASHVEKHINIYTILYQQGRKSLSAHIFLCNMYLLSGAV